MQDRLKYNILAPVDTPLDCESQCPAYNPKRNAEQREM